MPILSIQSHVAYGHVGNAAAVFPLQRLGFEVWPVHTVEFSNHVGYDSFRGRVLPPELVADVVAGIAERGVLGRCRAVLSGYLGDVALGEIVLGAVARVRTANPHAIYACDPVIGDVGIGAYVRPGIAEFFRDRAVPMADLVFPNQFELDALVGWPVRTRAEAIGAARELVGRGPRVVTVTSFYPPEAPDAIEALTVTADAAFVVRVPRLAVTVHGTGDAFAALFLARWIERPEPRRALELACAAIHGVLRQTPSDGMTEMALIAAQDELVRPSRTFTAEPVED
ncbi:MAG: pyridoxal kinase PdxY [Alphaproteobacteria bacterium]